MEEVAKKIPTPPPPPRGEASSSSTLAGTGVSTSATCAVHPLSGKIATFSVGQEVEYWSDSRSKWFPRVVMKVYENQVTYELTVKKKAPDAR